MIRRALAAFTALAVLAFPVAAGAATEDAPVGTARTDLTLASLGIDLPEVGGTPVGDLIDLGAVLATLDLDAIDLGALRSYSSTDTDAAMNALGDGDPFALAGVTLPLVGEVVARSDGPTTQTGQTVTLPQGLGEVTVGALAASVADGTASSAVDLLSGELDALVGGLSVGLPADGALSLVDGDVARAANGAVLEDLSLSLTDILPLEILELLPLEVLLGLADGLDLDLTTLTGTVRELVDGILELADLEAAITLLNEQIETLSAQLETLEGQVQGLNDAAEAAEAELDAAKKILADVVALDAAQTELAALETQILQLGTVAFPLVDATVEAICEAAVLLGSGAVYDLCQTRTGLLNTIADLTTSLGENADLTIADAQKLVDDAQVAFDLAKQALATLQQQISELGETIAALTAELNQLIEDLLELVDGLLSLLPEIDLDELLATLKDLRDGLAGLELLSIGEVVVGVTSVATEDGSRATALCQVDDVVLLGEAKAIDTCAQLQSILAQLQVVLEDLLGSLPIVGELALQGRSFAAVSALDGIVSVSGLTTATSPDDEKVGDYFRASAAIEALNLEVLPLELTQVTDGLVAELTGLVDDVLGDLGEIAGLDLAVLETQLETLLATIVAELPTGDLLGGVRTAGLSLDALAVGSESTFAAASTSGPVPIGGTPSTGTPTGATPQTPTPTRALPTTGGGAAGLALLMLSLGGGAAWAVRGRRG
jgi:predicted  nucleic acid-binding Zn-ribbon protein